MVGMVQGDRVAMHPMVEPDKEGPPKSLEIQTATTYMQLVELLAERSLKPQISVTVGMVDMATTQQLGHPAL